MNHRKGETGRKALEWQIKSFDDATGSFELYAAVFNNVDRANEIIVPGAIANMDAFVKDGWGALNHQWQDLPVALIDSAVQDSKGVQIRGRFHSHPAAQACRTVVKERMTAGKSVQCSIGYVVLDAAQEVRDGESVWILKSINLIEFSFVNFACNPQAGVTAAKSGGKIRLSQVDALMAEVKAGRTLSASNHSALTAVHSKLADACDRLKTFLDAHGPAGDADGKAAAPAVAPGKAGPDDGRRLVSALLANELRFPVA